MKRARPSSQLSQPSFSRALPIAIAAKSEHCATCRPAPVELDTLLAGNAPRRLSRRHAFAPGVVDTPMWIGLNEDIRAIHAQPVEADPMREFATGTLIGRPAAPDELAPFLVYLASPESDYMTGQMYMVDGGQILV